MSATQIKIAFVLINLVVTAGNGAFGVPPASTQQIEAQLAVNSINASGGVACRSLVPEFFTGDPVDESQLQQMCLQIAQAGVFAVIDVGAFSQFPAAQDCLPQHQIPIFMGLALPNTQLSQNYPYMFGGMSLDTLDRNTVFALKALGFFSNGFKKLGLIYRSCIPQVNSELKGWLGQVGVSSSLISTYDVGCPAVTASPSTLAQAVLQFQQAGVTNVMIDQFASEFADFTNIAQSQNFYPKYGIPDNAIIPITYGSSGPSYKEIANAVAITSDRYGEEHTPGMAPTAGTAKCNAIDQAGGQPTVYNNDGVGGDLCDLVWEIAAATDHAPSIKRTALAAGLQATGSIDYSYPMGPDNFSGPNVTVGGQFWRPDQFFTSCNCWRLTNQTFQPSY